MFVASGLWADSLTDLEHDEVHSFGGSTSNAVDVVLDVAAGETYRAAIGYFEGNTLGRDYDGNQVQQTWNRPYAIPDQAAFVYRQTIGTSTHEAILLTPDDDGEVTGRAVDLGFKPIDQYERLYVGGWYADSGMSFESIVDDLLAPTFGDDGFVARLTGAGAWAGHLLGNNGDARVQCLESSSDLVDVVPPGFLQRLPIGDEDGERSTVEDAVILACAGSFTDELDYEYGSNPTPVTVGQAIGVEDAFLLLLNAETGELLSSVTFGGSGSTIVIKALTTSFISQGNAEVPVIFVTGSFSDTINFNPNGTAVNKSATGASDSFVARYYPDGNDPDELVADGVWVDGETLEAGGEGIAIWKDNDDFNVFVAGWCDQGGVGGADVWFTRLDYSGSGDPTEAWNDTTLENSATCRAHDVALDAFNQVVITGFFANELDFDAADGSSDTRSSSSGSNDIFVTRYTFAGSYSGTDVFGGASSDVGYAIDANRSTGQYVYGGLFGGGSLSGYEVDFDPAQTEAKVTGRGGADGYISDLNLAPPEVDSAIVLLLDASKSMLLPDNNPDDPNDDGSCPQDSDFDREFDAIVAAYRDIMLTDDTILPRDGSVALCGIVFASDYGDEGAMVVVPWIAIDSYASAETFITLIEGVWLPGGGTTLADGLTMATGMFDDDLIDVTSGGDTIINVIGDGIGKLDDPDHYQDTIDAVEGARDAAIDGDVVKLINAVAIDVDQSDDDTGDHNEHNIPQLFEDHVIGANDTLIGSSGRRKCLREALGTYCACPPQDGDSQFEIQQVVKLFYEARVTCEGDLDNDCTVGQSDLGIVLAAYGSSQDDPPPNNYDPVADVDGDGDVDQSDLGVILASYDEC
jgi:hypothetical protein